MTIKKVRKTIEAKRTKKVKNFVTKRGKNN